MSHNLNERIRRFYNDSTQIWLDTWGEHMHHGHYGVDGRQQKDRRQAQVDMIEELLAWSHVNSARQVLDLGCGVGGSARYLAERFTTQALGLTLSDVQAEAAAEYNRAAGLEKQVTIRVQDMMTFSSPAGFDLVWSLESAEHIADKAALFDLIYRSLQPGGRLVMATWCIADEPAKLEPGDQKLLDQISRWYHLPPMAPIDQLADLARVSGFKQVKTDNWANAVAPFWSEVIRSALSLQGLIGLIRNASWKTIKGAWAIPYMNRAYRSGLLQYGVLQAVK